MSIANLLGGLAYLDNQVVLDKLSVLGILLYFDVYLIIGVELLQFLYPAAGTDQNIKI